METLLKTLAATIAVFAERMNPPVHDTHGRGRAKYVAVREGHKLTAIDPKATKKTHRLDTLESVLAYLGRHGKADETTVFVDRAAIQALLGDVEGGLDLDLIKCHLGESVELRAWKAIAGHKLPHKAFKNIIDDRAGDLAEGFEFLAPGLGMISARSSVSVDHDNSDGDRTSFAVADGAKIGTVALPNRFEISIPLFLAWPKPYVLSVRLENEIDAADKDKKPVVNFKIAFRDLEDMIDLAVRDMVADLNEKLGEGWLVVAGSPAIAAV